MKKGDSLAGGAGDDTIDLDHDPRPASEGTVVLLDGVSYINAPAAVVVDFRAAATVPIAAEGNDTVTGFNGGIRISGSSLGDTIKGTNSADVRGQRHLQGCGEAHELLTRGEPRGDFP